LKAERYVTQWICHKRIVCAHIKFDMSHRGGIEGLKICHTMDMSQKIVCAHIKVDMSRRLQEIYSNFIRQIRLWSTVQECTIRGAPMRTYSLCVEVGIPVSLRLYSA